MRPTLAPTAPPLRTGIEPCRQRLIVDGARLEETASLEEFGAAFMRMGAALELQERAKPMLAVSGHQ